MQRHAAQGISHHHHHHNHHSQHHMDQLQLQHHPQEHLHQHHQQQQQHSSRILLADQQDHYQQQYQHDDQHQHQHQQHQLANSVGLQQHYQQQQHAPLELGCGSVHYGYTSLAYTSHQPQPQQPAPVVDADQYEQRAQAPADSSELDADTGEYQLGARSDQKPPNIDEWELSEHHLQQHHANSFAYINNYPFQQPPPPHHQQQQQQHEHILQPAPQAPQHHLQLSTASRPPVEPSPGPETTRLCLVVEEAPQHVVAPPAPSELQSAVQHLNSQPAEHARTRSSRQSHQSTARAQAPTAATNGVSLDATTTTTTTSRQRAATRKQHNSAPVPAADQLEGKYPYKIKIGEHEEVEYLKDRIIVRNFPLQMEITLTNEELGDMAAKHLNRRLSKASTKLTLLVKNRRRTLKNRGYAANCRTKREAAKKDLEKDNLLLRERVNKLAIEMSQMNEKLQLALSASCTCLRQQIQQMVF